MEAASKILLNLIKNNLVQLTKQLEYKPLRVHLVQDDIFYLGVLETINALPTRGEQIEHLLSDALPRRPPEAVVLFAKALIETGQGHHLEEKGVSREDMDFIRGFRKDHTSQVVQEIKTNKERPGEDKPLWDPSHPDGQAFVRSTELGDKVIKVVPILKVIVSTADLWAHLQSHRVMDFADVDRCKKQAGPEADQVESIIDFLKKKEVWRVHAFFRSLAQTDQAAAIDVVLGSNGRTPYM